MRLFPNAPSGRVFTGESGSEVLFRLVRTATVAAAKGGVIQDHRHRHRHRHRLVKAALLGIGNLRGLAETPGVTLIAETRPTCARV